MAVVSSEGMKLVSMDQFDLGENRSLHHWSLSHRKFERGGTKTIQLLGASASHPSTERYARQFAANRSMYPNSRGEGSGGKWSVTAVKAIAKTKLYCSLLMVSRVLAGVAAAAAAAVCVQIAKVGDSAWPWAPMRYCDCLTK